MADGATEVPVPFPSTMWSEIVALQKDSPEERRGRLDPLIRRYWRPIYWTLRSDGRIREDEARDLTQEFFIKILEGQVIPGVDPERGSFRRYLRGALKNFLMNERRKENTLKRGSGKPAISIDFSERGLEPSAVGTDPDRALDQAWAFQVLNDAIEALEESLTKAGRTRDLEIFRIYDLSPDAEKPSYAEVAAKFGMPESEIWTVLRYCRRKLREIVIERLGPTVRSEADLYDELRELFGE